MKKLFEFDSVKAILEEVVTSIDVNNGTQSFEFEAYPYSRDTAYDKETAKTNRDIQKRMSTAIFAGDLANVELIQKEMELVKKAKIITTWRLMKPIPLLNGTKIIRDGEKTYSLKMEDVKEILISEDSIMLGLLEGEETTKTAVNIQGQDVKVMKLKLVKGLIDVAAPIQDWNENVIVPKRAMVTAISFRSMQIAAEMMNQEKRSQRRRYGFDENL